MAQCKYEMREHQISFDDGFSWTSLEVIRGDLIEYESEDCPDSGSEITKWVDLENDFLCDGNKKYKKQVLYTSYDNGVTWYIYYPTTYRRGEYIGVDEAFCSDKFEGHYEWDEEVTVNSHRVTPCGCHSHIDPIKTVKCNNSTTLTSGETDYYITSCTTSSEVIGCLNYDFNIDRCMVQSIRTTKQCYYLKNARIGSCVKTIGERAFYDDIYLSSVTISDGVETIGINAFQGCSALTSVNIPESVSVIDSRAFENCSSLSAITLPSNLETIGSYAFRNTNLQSTIDIPSGVTSIGSDVFGGTNVTTINMHSDTPPTLGSLKSGTITIYVPCGSVAAYKEAAGWSNYSNYIMKYEYCPYLGVKFFAVRNDGTTYTLECNESNVLTSGETYASCPYPTYAYNVVSSVTIGSCAEEIGTNAFRDWTQLVRVNSNTDGTFNIPSGVTTIGENAFQYDNVQILTMSDTLTSIGNYAFYNCSSLTSVTFENGLLNIGNNAFANCSGITSINLPNSVSNIGDSAFTNCFGLTSVTLGNGISNIGDRAFANCSGVTNLSIGSGITSIGNYAFYKCASITSLTIGSNIESIGNYAFNDCNNLKKIIIEAVTPPTLSGTSTFTSTNNCPIYVPCDSVDAYKSASRWSSYASRILPISSCPYDFKVSMYYTNGENIKLPCDSSTSVTYNDTSALFSKTSITSAEIGSCISTINNAAFSGCTSLSSITIPNSVGQIGSNAFSGATSLTSLTIPNSVGSVGSGVCQYCTSLQSVTLPYISKIGDKSFYNCNSLQSINIPNTVVTIGDNAFGGCVSATSISIGSAVTYINNSAFNGCRSLTSLTIPNSVVTIGNNAFYNCSSVSAITIPDNVLSIGTDSFSLCSGATSLSIGSRITSIKSAFKNCYGLTSVTIPDNVYDIQEAFYHCSGLTSVTIGSGVMTIGGYAFNGCSSLTGITIPNGVYTIGEYAFYGCTSLSSVTIPSGVTTIESGAFRECSGLTSITVDCETPPTLHRYSQEDWFQDTNNCPIYVPCDSVDAYKAAWSKYASRIQMKQGCPPPPTPPYAGDKFYAEYSNGSAYTIECNSSSTITSADTRPNGYTYTAMTYAEVGDCVTNIGDRTFSGATSLTSVTIGSGVTSIGSDAFRRCTSLQSIEIPNNVTIIGNNAFSGDTSVSSLSIGSGVTSIGQYAFYGNTSLISVTIPNSVTNIGDYAFRNCSNLDNIVVLAETPTTLGTSAFTDTNNCNIYVHCDRVDAYKAATNWSRYASRIQAFDDCSNVQYRWIADGYVCDGSDKWENKKYQVSYDNGVTWYDYGETSATTLIESNSLDCSKVKWETNDSTQGTKACDNSSVLSRSNINNGSIDNLRKIEIGDCVTTISAGTFSAATSLSSITIPSSITSIGYNAFYRCSGLTSITVDCETPPTLNGGYPFDGTNNCPIYVPCSSYCAYKSASGWNYYANRIRKKDNSCQYLGDKLTGTLSNNETFAIECCGTELSRDDINPYASMVSAVIGDCVTSIGSSAFTSCTSLSSVTISSGVTTIQSGAFKGCTSLTSVTIPSGVTVISGDVFTNCTSLTSITIDSEIPPTVAYNSFGSNYPIYVPCRAYLVYKTTTASTWSVYWDRIQKQQSCPMVAPIFSAEYSNGSAYTLDYYGSLTLTTGDTKPYGYEYTAMTSAVISDYINIIDGGAFTSFYSLSSVTLSKSIDTIPFGLFYNCTALTSVNIPSGVTRIESSAFEGCSILTSITIPSRVTTIGYIAFRGCSSLTSITIPSGVTSIGESAFENCTSLLSITVLAETPPILNNSVFYNTNNCPIYVPAASVEAYKTANRWSNYADRIQAIQ